MASYAFLKVYFKFIWEGFSDHRSETCTLVWVCWKIKNYVTAHPGLYDAISGGVKRALLRASWKDRIPPFFRPNLHTEAAILCMLTYKKIH